MRPIQWVWFELKRLSRNRFASLAAVVILLIPLLYSCLYLYAFWDPYNHLERMQVAVVNLDQAATKDEQTVNAGKDLVEKLKDDHTVGWKFTNQQEAMDGLNNSNYDLAIVIPKDFSQMLLDMTKDPGAGQQQQKARLDYYSDPSKNYLAEQIGNKVASKLQGDLNGQIAGNFLENVFSNLEDMERNLQIAADGSNKLQEGIFQAHSGSGEITQHLQEAMSGSATLDQGLQALSDGSGEVAKGNADLADGSTKLQEGSVTIQSGVNTALDGSGKLSAGSNELIQGLAKANQSLQDAASGSAQLYSGLSSAYDGSQRLQTGLGMSQAGSAQIESGAAQLYAGLNTMKSQLNSTDSDPSKAGVPVLIQGAQHIVTATSEPSYTPDNPQTIPNGVKVASDGIGQVVSGLNSAVPSLQGASTTLSDVISQLDLMLNADPTLKDNPQFMAAYTKASMEVAGVQQGIQGQAPALANAIGGLNQIQYGLTGHSTDPLHPTVLDGLRSLNTGSTQLRDGLQTMLTRINAGLDQMIDGASSLSQGSHDLNSGLTFAYSGSANLTEGLHDLTDGEAKLSSGLASGAADFPKLVDGGLSLQTGINQLKQGLADLSQGMVTFVQKMGDLVQGASKLADGAKDINQGATQAVTGSTSLHNGLVQLHDGSSSLTDGLGQAVSGSNDLTTGLKDGVTKLQKNLPQNPSTVSQAMGQPVEVEETKLHPVQNYGTGFAPYFVPLSLWVGALMLFFLINLKENSLQAAGVSKVRILLGKSATFAFFGAAQAVISSFVLITFLGLRPNNVLYFYGFNILQSLSYVSIIFLFVSLFDMAGRFIAILLLMLQLTSGGGTFPVTLIPKFFQVLHPYLPMTYGIEALRNIISGSANIPLQTSVFALLCFGVGALALAVLLSPKRLRVKDLHPSPQLGT
ncbi:MAG: YhgE/Pip domain-containing protein [Bacillota bacterium]|nr:YhgE/Pip domain-containing protein [Bacillota bacterium]